MYPIIKLTEGNAYDRGMRYGQLAKPYIELCVSYYKRQFLENGTNWETLRQFIWKFGDTIGEHYPEQLEELKGIAAGSGQELSDIMIINARYEVSKFPKDLECTTGAVFGTATADGHVYGFKNWDFNQLAREHIVILDITFPDQTRSIAFAEAGQVMRDGCNSHGIAILANNLQSVSDYAGYGIPVTCLRRNILTCKTFEEAELQILGATRTVSNNMILIDSSQGKVRNYEWQPDGNVDIIEPEQDVITHANHFVVHPERDALVGRPKNRDVRLRELLMAHHGHIDLEVIMNCLKDHKYYSLSVCSHPNPEGDTYSKNRMTVSSMICDFTLQKVYITAGPPCCNAYIAFDLSEIS